jgi:hypothetical protein
MILQGYHYTSDFFNLPIIFVIFVGLPTSDLPMGHKNTPCGMHIFASMYARTRTVCMYMYVYKHIDRLRTIFLCTLIYIYIHSPHENMTASRSRSRSRSWSRIFYLNTRLEKSPALSPSCPDYYTDLFRAPLHEV